MPLLLISHAVNVVVAGLLPVLLFTGRPHMESVYGPDTPARRILACVYAAIALASAAALLARFSQPSSSLPVRVALVLFPLQIVYKLSTLPAVGWTHPVAVSNALIAALHAAALWSVRDEL